ncbi:J domain-containing protein [Caldiplasma sukawensis]
MKDYYDILGVSHSASTDEIKASYRKLIRKWHPDLNKEDRDISEIMTKNINEAFEVLSNPEKRIAYDRENKKTQWTINEAKFKDVKRETVIINPTKTKRKKNDFETEINRKWSDYLMNYISRHKWAERIFDSLNEDEKIRFFSGNASIDEIFSFYVKLEIGKTRLGFKSPYFNEKLLLNKLENYEKEKGYQRGIVEISGMEMILQVYYRIKAGVFDGTGYPDNFNKTLVKLYRIHKYLIRNPEGFFQSLIKFGVTKKEYDEMEKLLEV